MNQIPLTDQEYHDIHQKVQSLPQRSLSVRIAHGQIIRQNGQLRRFGGWKALNEAYIIKRNNEIQFQKIDSSEAQQRILSINTNPGYLLHNVHPMYASRCHLLWSQTEKETLQSIIEKSSEKKPDWGLISLSLPGRNGHLIQQHYNEMIARGDAVHATFETTKINPFGDMTKKTFLPRDFYYTSYVIAERITYEIFSRSNKQIYTTFTKNRYTDDFINECRERESRYQNSTNAMLEEIDKSGLSEPQFSDHWVRDFMKRIRLSVRQAHF